MKKGITKVPNGPLIKKKGVFKGSTLKNGGPIDTKKYLEDSKKRVNKIVTPLRKAELKKGINTYEDYLNSKVKDKKKNGGPVQKERRTISVDKTAVKKVDANKIMKNDNEITARNLKNTASYHKNHSDKKYQAANSFLLDGNRTMYDFATKEAKKDDSLFNVAAKKAKDAKANPRFKGVNSFPKLNVKKKAKAGAMIKRADGSMSRRGLWDNIRANKGSGKKPTAAMLKQERKIKAKAKK
jgi:hypothetical protein